MSSEKLIRARTFEEEKEKQIGCDERPAFHLAARVGWMNDPNGFSWYKGQYHLFYQYCPYKTHWGPMHWAHAVSDDLLTWTHLPTAIAPDEPYDKNGCFSGNAIELEDGRHLLMYTGVRIEEMDDGCFDEFQTQCVAVGDGVNYQKMENNPVLDATDLPAGASARDFRDPKVWKAKDGSYRAVVASRAEDGTGQILLFRSEDGFSWVFVKVLAKNLGRYGIMWECPDFFELDGKNVLFISPQDMLKTADGFHSGSNNICIIGSYDEETETFTEESVQVIDEGVDYYAMQTVLAPDGRRIMIAWMQNWDTQEHVLGEKWFGQMSLPREISVKNGRLYQQPIREIEALRVREASHRDVRVSDPVQLEGVCGRYADMTIALRPGKDGKYERFTMTLAKDGNFGTAVVFEPKTGMLTIDRSTSGTRRAHAHVRRMYVGGESGELKLRVILDKNSMEVFVGEGEKAATMVLCTRDSADGIEFDACGEAAMDVVFHELKH